MRIFSWKWNVLLVGMVAAFASASMADQAGDAVPSSPETWNRWETRGVRLGTPRKELIAKGFTCGKAPRSPCYKLVDKRCTKHARCELKQDAFNNWFELNGQRVELDLLSI